ncbi:hypothetical protein Poli38472_002146 [Pythium oligandrum]|uniref:SET domain-containing protein n=1 Tax=Pythium oligandrum TaxID=41045 RepID=A0A8K1CH97_PYTOL|nr:hypothetical protein Poli38472_002146 [Pythium oligandrum]|eukprot:TMW63205.1 hypothetical protein Poli38472_002146 [Pythium oligandrum]
MTSPLVRGVQDAVRRVSGAFVSPSIEARLLPGMGMGVVAREPIPKDTLIFQASRDVWYPFSAEFALHEAQQKAPGFVKQLDTLFASSNMFKDRTSFLPNAIVLGTHLAMSQGAPAPSHPTTITDAYIPSLPEFIDLPFYWDEQQFKALEACEEVRQSIQQSAQLYLQIYQHLFGANNQMVAPETFFWAISILMSRATSGKAQPFTLIPFFDWFNHSDSSNECVHEYDSQRGFVVHTARDYQANEQLFINYGHHSNTRLLRNYGFTLSENPYDQVNLTLPVDLQRLDQNDPHITDKQAILNALRMPPGARALTFSSEGRLAPSSHQWLLLRLAEPAEMAKLINSATQGDPSADNRNAALEKRVGAHVHQLAQMRLGQHETSVEDDAQFLQLHEQQMASWMRSALHIRLSEKRILQKVFDNSA